MPTRARRPPLRDRPGSVFSVKKLTMNLQDFTYTLTVRPQHASSAAGTVSLFGRCHWCHPLRSRPCPSCPSGSSTCPPGSRRVVSYARSDHLLNDGDVKVIDRVAQRSDENCFGMIRRCDVCCASDGTERLDLKGPSVYKGRIQKRTWWRINRLWKSGSRARTRSAIASVYWRRQRQCSARAARRQAWRP
jgi:hypothetical protein